MTSTSVSKPIAAPKQLRWQGCTRSRHDRNIEMERERHAGTDDISTIPATRCCRWRLAPAVGLPEPCRGGPDACVAEQPAEIASAEGSQTWTPVGMATPDRDPPCRMAA